MVTALARMGSSVLSCPASLAQAEIHRFLLQSSVGVLIHLQNKVMQH